MEKTNLKQIKVETNTLSPLLYFESLSLSSISRIACVGRELFIFSYVSRQEVDEDRLSSTRRRRRRVKKRERED